MATQPALVILVLVLMLQVKHAICDGPLQSRRMVTEKSGYGRGAGLAHAGLHGLGSLAALLLFGVGAGLSAGLAIADSIVHYHVDFAKENIVKKRGWSARDSYFWWSLAADQTLHHVTYIAMAAAVVLWA